MIYESFRATKTTLSYQVLEHREIELGESLSISKIPNTIPIVPTAKEFLSLREEIRRKDGEFLI